MEMLIVVAVAILLLVIITAAFSSFRDTQALNGSVEEIVAAINKARSSTLSSQNSLQHGIHFESGRVVIFQGAAFSASDPANEEIKFSPFVEISLIALNGGGSDMVFQKLTGKTDQYGAITLRVRKNTSDTKIISVKSTGVVSIQ